MACKKFMGKIFTGIVRSTFLIGADGKIEEIWDPVNAKGHAAEVFETSARLGSRGNYARKNQVPLR